MAATVEDHETRKAFEDLFNADPVLSAACPGGLTSGPPVAGTPTRPKLMPFARLECEQGPRPNEYRAPVKTGQGYIDHRKVTITVIGLRPDVVAAFGEFRRVYEFQPGKQAADGAPQMIVGSLPTRTMIVRPQPASGTLAEDPTYAAGKACWRGTLIYEVETSRSL